ncbi:MAG: ThuA domain-containing protein [Gemmataceae bacterium]
MRNLVLSLLLAGFAVLPARADEPKPIRALLVLGGCCHDYAKQQEILTKGISARANVEWKISYDKDTGTKSLNPIYQNKDWYKGFDVVVHDECCADVNDPNLVERVLHPHKEGLPAVVLHCGMHSYRTEDWKKGKSPWFEFTGLATTGHGPQLPIEISYAENSPITKGLSNWKTINEELYNNLTGKLYETATPIARGKQVLKTKDGKTREENTIVVWTNDYNKKARVFGTTLGHNNDTVADAKYLDLVTRGLLWSVNKLDDAHMKPASKVKIVD